MTLTPTQARLLADQFRRLYLKARRSDPPMSLIVGVGLKGMLMASKRFGYEFHVTSAGVTWVKCPIPEDEPEKVAGEAG